MRTTGAETPSRSPTTLSEDASGYLLLTIPHAQAKQVYEEEVMVLAKGELKLECISLPIPAEIGHQTANPFAPSPSDPLVPTHDFWLVLRIGNTFEIPLMPQQPFVPVPGNGNGNGSGDATGITYSMVSPHIPNAALQIVLGLPTSNADMEDLDSFEVLLRQYGSLAREASALLGVTAPTVGAGVGTAAAPLPQEMRGKLVLINEDNGEVVGELDQELDIEEDRRIAGETRNKPVMLDFGNVDAGYAPVVKIQTVPEDEMDDWMLKGAHNISRGILGFSSLTQKTINWGAETFIKNTKPAEKPVELSHTTKNGIRVAHNASVRTVKVTKKTMGMINDGLMNVAEKTYSKAVEPGVKMYQEAFPNTGEKLQGTFNESREKLRRFSEDLTKPAIPPKPLSLQVPKSGNSSPLSSTSSVNLPASPTGANRPAPPPPLPARKSPLSPVAQHSILGEKIPLPSKTEALLAEEEDVPPAYGAEIPRSESPLPASPSSAKSATTKSKRPFFNRIILAGEVVLSSLEATAHDLITTGTNAAASAAGHKFGPQAGQATALAGGAVRNVAVVYIDIRGVGRKALLKGTAKGFVKARLKGGETVQLQGDGEGHIAKGNEDVEAGQVEKREEGGYVVGIHEVGRSTGISVGSDEKGLSKRLAGAQIQ